LKRVYVFQEIVVDDDCAEIGFFKTDFSKTQELAVQACGTGSACTTLRSSGVNS
jgi:hypothetical protein